MKRESVLKLVVDRIEGGKAVLVLYDDDSVRFSLPITCLPEGTRGGDHLNVTFTQDLESREAEIKRAEQLLMELKGSKPR